MNAIRGKPLSGPCRTLWDPCGTAVQSARNTHVINGAPACRGRRAVYSGMPRGCRARKYVQLVSFGSVHFSGAWANSGCRPAM